MGPIDLTVDYTPSNWTLFEEALEAEEWLKEEDGLAEAAEEELPLAWGAAAGAQPAPVRRRKLASDISFASAYSDLSMEDLAAPEDRYRYPALQAVPAAVNDTDIIQNPDAFISWVPLNTTASPCLMTMDSELPVDFLLVRLARSRLAVRSGHGQGREGTLQHAAGRGPVEHRFCVLIALQGDLDTEMLDDIGHFDDDGVCSAPDFEGEY